MAGTVVARSMVFGVGSALAESHGGLFGGWNFRLNVVNYLGVLLMVFTGDASFLDSPGNIDLRVG